MAKERTVTIELDYPVQLPDGELALGKDLHHFLSDGAAGAENGNMILLHIRKLPFLFDKAVVQNLNGGREILRVHADDDVELVRPL